MRRCKKYNRRFKRGIIAVFILLFLVVVFWLFMSYCINPVIKTVSTEEIRALTVKAVNNAAGDAIAFDPNYAHLVDIIKDENGKIQVIQANASKINKLARVTTDEAQKNITNMGELGVGIPIGSLSGLNFLAGRGPEVRIKMLPVGSINVGFLSEFIAAGINQTNHKIFMNVTASVSIVIPGMNNSITTTTEVLICENIIVGEVPQVYFNSSKDNLLNLTP